MQYRASSDALVPSMGLTSSCGARKSVETKVEVGIEQRYSSCVGEAAESQPLPGRYFASDRILTLPFGSCGSTADRPRCGLDPKKNRRQRWYWTVAQDRTCTAMAKLIYVDEN
jgi:hypothetical protein